METKFVEPRVVSIRHDGREVVRIVDGVVYGVMVSKSPSLLEICWDDQLVYALRDGVVEVNQIRLRFESLVITEVVPQAQAVGA
ncbi:hypothetical protein [Stenomitos frigidus]|uniref:Uncharacterized protein n=1 Tax=Stenomitos frigidus ULC18 TaxID=2107698 RepID=A0A2T1EFW1_9CYAN|nr:hypothetical protein [Stenomitos frigidus]PSB31591.1 hypothetical protein C7B82_07135 [Stenomitos frigidus ULC18]